MKVGSINSWVASMVVGEYRFVESNFDDYPNTMRALNPAQTKRPPELKGRVFTTALYTAIGNGNPRDVRALVRVERLK
jgi:hypothetical protein